MKLGFLSASYPYVQSIVVEAREIVGGTETSWQRAAELGPSTTSYAFTNGQVVGALTIGPNKTFDVRVFAVNFADQIEANHLQYSNLAFEEASPPSAPQAATLQAAQTTLTVNVTRPALNNVGDAANPQVPDLQSYRIVWKAVSSTRYPAMFESTAEVPQVFAASPNPNSSPKSFTISSRNPSTTYQLMSIAAKNVINPDFGAEFSPSPPLTTTTTGLVNADVVAVAGFASDFTTALHTLWNPGLGSTMTNVNYYTGSSTIARNGSTSSFYVNGGRQGTVASGVSALVTLVSAYNTNTNQAGTLGTWQNDATVRYHGYGVNDVGWAVEYTGTDTASAVAAGVDTISWEDARSGTGGAYNGFVILGKFRILPTMGVFPASRDVYGLRYTLSSLGSRANVATASPSANEVKLHTFVVDTLSGEATITNASSVISSITSTATCHGVPSIRAFDVSYDFTAGNLGEQFLRSDRRYANVSLTSPCLPNPNTDFNFPTSVSDTPIPDQTLTGQTLANRHISNATTYANPGSLQTSIPNVVNFRAYNLLTSGTPAATITSLTFGASKPLWHDATSFKTQTSPTTQISTTVVDMGNLNLNLYDATDRFQFPLAPYSSQTTEIADNQLIFAANAFRGAGGLSSSSYYRDYRDFAAPGPDYSAKHETGDVVGSGTYKWVVKRFENQTSFTTVDTNTQDKTLRLTINSTTYGAGFANSLSSLTSSTGALCFVRQIQTGGQGSNATAWLNVTQEFGGSLPKLLDTAGQSLDTTPGYGNLDSTGKIKMYSTGFSTDLYTIYVRVGLLNGSTESLLSSLTLT